MVDSSCLLFGPITLRSHGFPVEEHTIETSDGFLLAGWRLPRPGLPPVFLKHGWTCQSAIFFSGDGGYLDPSGSGSVIGGNNASIPLYLYATGKVDVWLVDDRQRPRPRHKIYGIYICIILVVIYGRLISPF